LFDDGIHRVVEKIRSRFALSEVLGVVRLDEGIPVVKVGVIGRGQSTDQTGLVCPDCKRPVGLIENRTPSAVWFLCPHASTDGSQRNRAHRSSNPCETLTPQ
jgi:hypothetical protein